MFVSFVILFYHFILSYTLIKHDRPVGINNIGNTCYLSSLLQFFFSFKSLRECILDFNVISLDKSVEIECKMNSMCINKVVVVEKLQKLFKEMQESNSSAVTPDKRLVQLALYDGQQSNQQQDISECMDSCMDKLFKVFQSESQTLFFGKMKQTLTFQDSKNSNQQEQVFNHLIVDVCEDIYSCLDSFFSFNQVFSFFILEFWLK